MMFLVGNFIVRAHGRNCGGIVIFFMVSNQHLYVFTHADRLSCKYSTINAPILTISPYPLFWSAI